MSNKTFGAILSLKDEISSSLKGIQESHTAFGKEVQRVQSQISKSTKMNVETSSAMKKVQHLSNSIKSSKLGKAVTTTLAARDRATAKIKKVSSNLRKLTSRVTSPIIRARDKTKSVISSVRSRLKAVASRVTSPIIKARDKTKSVISGVKSRLKSISSKVFSPIIKAKDKTKSVISGVKNKLMSLKTLAGGLVIGAVAKAGFDNIIKPGAELEGYKTSMTHWMGGDEKGADAYLGQLRKEADKTPFETGEVIQAGSRAIGLTDGDTGKAMEMVKLAEDMAALTPGKTVSDAMEAIADGQMGEMERLKEFQFKGSKEDFDKAGGDLLKMKGTNGKGLQETFKGGAQKQSETASGKWSTITGNIQAGLQTGGAQILERLKPVLDKLVPASEKLAEKLPKAIDFVADKFQAIWTYLQPSVMSIVNAFNDLWQKSEPFRNTLANLGQAVLPFLKAAFEGVAGFISDVLPPILEVFGTVIENVLIPAFETATDIINNIVKPAFKTIGDFISDKIVPIFEKLSGAIKSIIDWIKDKLSWLIGNDDEESGSSGSGSSSSGGGSSSSGGGGLPRAYTGIQRVPYDGFVAQLHKDEAVLPAVSNPYNPNYDKWNNGRNTTSASNTSTTNSKAQAVNATINIYAQDRTDKEVADKMAKELLLVLGNM